ncbi:MAG: hypothetical protein IKL51_07070 [Lachnospiraceae bacterium]|nr:hypothetical protein [Lachnospiraceae bacterium]
MGFLLYSWVYYTGIIIFFICSISIQMIVGYYVLKMEKESQSLEEGNAALLLPCIKEYVREELKIRNISLFIERNLREIRIKKISLIRLKHISGQSLLFGIFLAGVGACIQIIAGKTLGQILPFYLLSFLGLYCYFSLSSWVDYEERKKEIKENLLDFFEHKKYWGIYQKFTLPEVETKEENYLFGEEEGQQLRELLREILA